VFADLDKVDDARIRVDLTQIKPLTTEIRTYTLAHGFDRVPAIASSLGLKVSLGLWLGQDKAANEGEIARAIAVVRAHPKAITRVVVGNEALQHGYLQRDELIAAMARVREGIAGTDIPVGTGEIWSVWLGNKELTAAADFIGAHILPYWDGVGIAEAPAYVVRRYDELAQAFPGKPIVIAETGWPASGPVRQAAAPSMENQTRFAENFAALARIRGFAYALVEAYDQPWKAAREGDTPLWGLFDPDRTPKAAALQLRAR